MTYVIVSKLFGVLFIHLFIHSSTLTLKLSILYCCDASSSALTVSTTNIPNTNSPKATAVTIAIRLLI
jgi:hypothetical protein